MDSTNRAQFLARNPRSRRGESRHLSVLTNIAANAIVPAPDLPTVLTAAKATAAVTPFLA
jgi:hypothetical protein